MFLCHWKEKVKKKKVGGMFLKALSFSSQKSIANAHAGKRIQILPLHLSSPPIQNNSSHSLGPFWWGAVGPMRFLCTS